MELAHIENALFHLDYRWKLHSLAMWKGERPPFELYRFYEAYEEFVSLKTLALIDSFDGIQGKVRLRHALMDHYLQRALLPHEMEMRTWMKGASAHVDGRKIYFSDIISWCQKQSDYEGRQVLQRETAPLCKFLAPFALNYWNILLEILTGELGFESYLDYCGEKKGLDYHYYYQMLKNFLPQSDDIYFPAMEQWCKERFGHKLDELTRFDAIHILGLGHLDALFPDSPVNGYTPFFHHWGIDLENASGLNLEIGTEKGKNAQAISFILQVPDEVYVLMKPEGGWIDLETLWHELGHGLSAVFTSPGLSIVNKDLATSFSLSEAFAFLNQNITLSVPFLVDYLGFEPAVSETLHYYKVLKDLSMFRRYAAKFVAEYEMFQTGNLSDGRPYAEVMARYTGFYYQPESHLFDLVPEFYSLDYVLGWLTETILEGHLRDRLGVDWMFQEAGGRILKDWWGQGNENHIPDFLRLNGLETLNTDRIMRRWKEVLGRK
ncbi:MAG: hypothetical protein K9N21_02870 [Deltaproteobacteria bacterium]|nr:hypothetical protein [Deltaproteobacteria bacterium]